MKSKYQKEFADKINIKPISKVKNTNMILAAFMIFIFPLLSIFLGVFIGGYIGKFITTSILIFQVIGGVTGFILSGVVIKVFDKASEVDKNTKKIHWDDL